MGKERILIVDDDNGVREMLADFFDVLGYRSVSARNGEEALGLLKRHKVCLVISDIKMPVMDGIEMLQRIREKHTDLGVILITGYEPDYSRETIRAAGASDYITKPFDIDVIEKKVRSLIEKRYEYEADGRIDPRSV